jgi:hypothetical protein
MRLRAAILSAVVVLAIAPGCSRGGGGDDGFRLELDGRAEVGDRTLGEGGHRVAEGDVVRMLDGDAVLELPGDRSLLLRAEGDDASIVEVGAEPDVREGSAVVLAGDDDASFTVGDVEVRLFEGAARVQHGLSVTVGVYSGAADVRAAGRPFAGGLTALRQLSIPTTGVLPREAVPLVYDDADPDPWDMRFIGDAIDLGDELDRKSLGYTGQLGPGARADATLLSRVLPGFRPPSDVAFTERTPGESLVGAAIALEAGADVGDVFAFRDDGARWGLVALDQKVRRDALIDRIDGALGRSPLLFAAGPTGGAGGGTTGSTTVSTTPPGTTPPTTEPDDGGGDDPTTTTTPTLPPLPPITLPPLAPDTDESDSSPPNVVDVIGDVVNDLLDPAH